jgi:hypothetical protein
MRRILALAMVFSLAGAPLGVGSPSDGDWSKNEEISPGVVWTRTKMFRGGERAGVSAAVLTPGGGAQLRLAVFDKKGELVAEDQGTKLISDFVAVSWYPPRDGEYRIELRNTGTRSPKIWIAIR